jgi:hypothetical protein
MTQEMKPHIATVLPSNQGLERTALCAEKIAAILRAGSTPTVFAI